MKAVSSSLNDHPLVRELYADYRIEVRSRAPPPRLAGSGKQSDAVCGADYPQFLTKFVSSSRSSYSLTNRPNMPLFLGSISLKGQ